MDNNFKANRVVAAWRDLIGDALPKKLVAAADALEAVEYAQSPGAGFDPAKLTAANAEQKVIELAQAVGTDSAFSTARAQALNLTGSYVLQTARDVLPDVLTVIEPLFRSAVDSLSQALDVLPEDSSAEGLVSAGPSAVQAFQQAKSAEADLDSIDRFIASLGELFGVRADPVLRLLTPRSREALAGLLRAHDRKGPIRPLWVEAVNNPGDVSWTLNTPPQARDIRSALDQAPASEYKKPQFLRFA